MNVPVALLSRARLPQSLRRTVDRSRRVAPAAPLLSILVAFCVGGCAVGDPAPPVLTTSRIEAIVASPDRSDADRTNDMRRKPVEMLAFIGVRPGMTVLDVSAGGGYTSELLARSVGPGGRVYGQSAPPDPQAMRPAAPEGGAGSSPVAGAAPVIPAINRRMPLTSAQRLAERAKNPAASNIVAVVQPFERPAPTELASQSFDLVTLMFNYHDLGYLTVDRIAMDRAILAALKPGGVYVIADHAGRPGTGISESGTLHRVEPEFVVREVESVGFRLVARGTFLANPNDPRDRNEPDPPQPKDEFVLKFVKP